MLPVPGWWETQDEGTAPELAMCLGILGGRELQTRALRPRPNLGSVVQPLLGAPGAALHSSTTENKQPRVPVNTFNPSSWDVEAKAGTSHSSRPAWSTELVPGHPRLHREILSENKTKLTVSHDGRRHPQRPFNEKQDD